HRHAPQEEALGALDQQRRKIDGAVGPRGPEGAQARAPRADEALGEWQHGEGDEKGCERQRPGAERSAQEAAVPNFEYARHGRAPYLKSAAGDYSSPAASRPASPSIPSSFNLRVRVLRPQPKSFAASWRCPWVRRSAARINTRSNC